MNHLTFPSKQELRKDYCERTNPELMNRLLYRAVPVLEHTGWKITCVAPGFTESILPLNSETTNQHGTHQAALISLSADYTGGMALTTLLTGVPLSGIHKCKPEDAASLWLASMNVKYLSPSTGHLTATCRIDEETAAKIKSRYFQGKRVLVSLPIEFTSNGEKVATAELKYFAQPTVQLLSSASKSPLFNQKIKASARMIAGVRASKDADARIRVDCPHATKAAGPHGILLAKRLRTALPQLTDMVLARTKHIDETIASTEGLEQILMLGAGLDMRPFRHAKRLPETRFFEVDLPDMIIERNRVIANMGLQPNLAGPKRYSISADFLKDNIAKELIANSPFDPTQKTLIIYEGCSMYFTRETNLAILKNIWDLTTHTESQIWCDVVASSVVNQSEKKPPEVVAFLKQMDDLGESFVFGTDEPCQFTQSIGCRTTHSMTCREFLKTSESIFDVYQFCVGKKI